MFGTFFNVTMIILGSLIGSLTKKYIKPVYHTVLMQSIGLAAIVIGIHAVIKPLDQSTLPVLFIISLAIGGIIGTAINIQDRFDQTIQKFTNSDLSTGLATAILLYCFGSLSILGPIKAALQHDYTFLLTNGGLDFITSIVLSATFGLGIMWAAVVLFCWQGGLYLLALLFQTALSTTLLNELTIIGGILILASGLSVLEIKKINTLNLLPALLVPPVVLAIMHFI
ncbi:DUF554 domain-containing protein [Weissella paramesenteroides]|jgi:uncharacterized membrane protein YqgA involved in biofilm formation|uniref:DUF554 domain-containing protein n=1 Tax=Weissella paramesenteroides TaxID=1249 RepID=UPI002E7C1558|nr:DUF554 domain-containing protein [Weissella paramesenteroides]WPQ68078.1 DUF554 domain-containing protein [Weissella paramesenteroides]